jgi:hypothetical protein
MHRGDDRYEWLPPNTVTSISVMKMYTSTTHCTIEYTFRISNADLPILFVVAPGDHIISSVDRGVVSIM